MISAEQARRRFVLLTGLRWLPVGFTIPVTVLLATSRGLSPAQIGLVLSAHGAVIVLLELPTGGLADALGRRPVLLLSGVCNLLGLGALALAQDAVGFASAYALIGVGRALDSGPLEAWYVDAVHAADPDGDPGPGLAGAGVADGVALAGGALLGGSLPVLAADALWAPFAAAAVLTGVSLVAVAVLVVPVHRPASRRRARAVLREGVAGVAPTVRTALRLSRRDPGVRRYLLLSLGLGPAFVCVELLAPLRLAELQGGAAEGTRAYGLVLAAGFAAAALGSSVAVRLRDALGGPVRTTSVLLALGAPALGLMALGTEAVVLGAGALLFYLFNGAQWPLLQQLLHSRVGAAQRATVVSVGSLALQLGGIVANQVQPALYSGLGPAWAFGSAAAVMLLLAVVAAGMPGPRAVEPRVVAAADSR